MAQQVEHILGKDEVVGSNPISSSRNGKLRLAVFLFPCKAKTATECFRIRCSFLGYNRF